MCNYLLSETKMQNFYNMSLFLQIVHKKTATALCLTSVKNEDKMEFSKIVEAIKVCN